MLGLRPDDGLSFLDEVPIRNANDLMTAIAAIDGIASLPANASVHSALIDLMSGEFDAGADGDTEGSDGGEGSDDESKNAAAADASSSMLPPLRSGGCTSSSNAGMTRAAYLEPRRAGGAESTASCKPLLGHRSTSRVMKWVVRTLRMAMFLSTLIG